MRYMVKKLPQKTAVFDHCVKMAASSTKADGLSIFTSFNNTFASVANEIHPECRPKFFNNSLANGHYCSYCMLSIYG